MNITATFTELVWALEAQKISPDEFRELVGLSNSGKTAYEIMKSMQDFPGHSFDCAVFKLKVRNSGCCCTCKFGNKP